MLTRWFTNLLLLVIIALSFSVRGEAVEFKVIALFKNAVMIEVEGKQKMLRKGQFYKKSIQLISADSHKANFKIDGKHVSLGLHQSKFGGYTSSNNFSDNKKFVQIVRGPNGMYQTSGFINGVKVNFLVDTGATTIAMNEKTAKRIGLQYKLKGQISHANTAGGVVETWFLHLDRVRVGDVELKQVGAVVIKGVGLDEVLLGMSFLKQLKMQDDGKLLKLTKKY